MAFAWYPWCNIFIRWRQWEFSNLLLMYSYLLLLFAVNGCRTVTRGFRRQVPPFWLCKHPNPFSILRSAEWTVRPQGHVSPSFWELCEHLCCRRRRGEFSLRNLCVVRRKQRRMHFPWKSNWVINGWLSSNQHWRAVRLWLMFRSSMKWKMENQFQLQINSFQFTDAFSPRQSLLNLFHDPTKASVEGVGSKMK